MSARENAGDRPRRGGLAPAAVALAATAWVLGWLLIGAPGNLYVGFAGAPIAMAAAVVAGRRIVAVERPGPVRTFWRQLTWASGFLLVASVVSLLRANNNTGLSPWVGLPMLAGIAIL